VLRRRRVWFGFHREQAGEARQGDVNPLELRGGHGLGEDSADHLRVLQALARARLSGARDLGEKTGPIEGLASVSCSESARGQRRKSLRDAPCFVLEQPAAEHLERRDYRGRCVRLVAKRPERLHSADELGVVHWHVEAERNGRAEHDSCAGTTLATTLAIEVRDTVESGGIAMNRLKGTRRIFWLGGVVIVLLGIVTASLVLPNLGPEPGADSPDIRVPKMQNVPPDQAPKMRLDVEKER
jgi:hypothetical protein